MQPPNVDALAATVVELREDDARARRIATAGAAWARRELTREVAWCYWAHLIDLLAALERESGGPQFIPRPYEQTTPERPYHMGRCIDKPTLGALL